MKLFFTFTIFILAMPSLAYADEFGSRFYNNAPSALSSPEQPAHPADIEPAAGEEEKENVAEEPNTEKKQEEKLDKDS